MLFKKRVKKMTSCDVAVTPKIGWKEMLKLKLYRPLEFLTHQKTFTKKAHHLKSNVENKKQHLYGQVTKMKDKSREGNNNDSFDKIKDRGWKKQNIPKRQILTCSKLSWDLQIRIRSPNLPYPIKSLRYAIKEQTIQKSKPIDILFENTLN